MNAANFGGGSAGMARPNSAARMVGKMGLGAVALAAVVSVVGISASQAGIIYQDNFARTGNLAGSTPAPTDATASTWTAAGTGTFTTNGSVANISAVNSLAEAYLPFNLQPSSTYAFSATLTPAVGTDGYWLAMGFGNGAASAASSGHYINSPTTEAWLIYGDNGTTSGFYGGPSYSSGNNAVNNQFNGSTGVAGTADTFTITLSTPSDLATGSASLGFYDTLGLLGTQANPRTGSLTSAELANVDSIIIGDQYIDGTVASLQLAGPVPEPGAVGLLVMGGAGLLLMGRRCRMLSRARA